MKSTKKLVSLAIASMIISGMLVGCGNITGSKADNFNSFINYKIDANLNEKDQTITAKQNVKFKNVYKDELKEISFNVFADAYNKKETQTEMFTNSNEKIAKDNPDKKSEDFLGGIDIKSIKNSDGKELKFTKENQVLKVELEKGLKNSEEVSFDIEFDVKIPFGMNRLSYYNDVFSAVHWYPVVAVYDEKEKKWNEIPYSKDFETDYFESSNYEVNLNVPKDFNVGITGTETEKIEGDRKIVSAKAENTREFVFFASKDYKKASKTKDGITVNIHYLSEDEKKDKLMNEYIDEAFSAIEFFGKKFGKYPYKEFDIFESYVEGVAIEYTGAIQLGRFNVDGNNPKKNSVFIHEIAHQWFHGIIGNNSETESFLDEGFADFSTYYYLDKTQGSENGFESMLLYESGPANKKITSTNKEVDGMSSQVYYDRGRTAIYELYKKVGEEKFDKLMQTYFDKYKFKNSTIKGLIETIEEVCGKDVADHFKNIINDPNFDLSDEYKLSPERQAELQAKSIKELYDNLFQMESTPELSLARIMHRRLNEEKVTLVKATGVSEKENIAQSKLIEKLTLQYEMNNVNFEVVEDSKVDENAIKNNNLIILGNSWNNSFYKKIENKINKKVTKEGFTSDKNVKNENIFGAFIDKNPENEKYLAEVIFWNGEISDDENFEKTSQDIITKSTSFGSNFYEYIVYSNNGERLLDKKEKNPYSDFLQMD